MSDIKQQLREAIRIIRCGDEGLLRADVLLAAALESIETLEKKVRDKDDLLRVAAMTQVAGMRKAPRIPRNR